jgi:hypothetical protein
MAFGAIKDLFSGNFCCIYPLINEARATIFGKLDEVHKHVTNFSTKCGEIKTSPRDVVPWTRLLLETPK